MVSVIAVADVPTASVQITINNEIVNDTFTRVVANGWGAADTGQAWTTAGGVAADFSVNGTQGIHRHTAVNSLHRTNLTTGVRDNDVRFEIVGLPLATGAGGFQIDAVPRLLDGGNLYYAQLTMAVGGTVTLELRVDIAGVGSSISGTPLVLPHVHLAGDTWTIRSAICDGVIMAKAWRSSSFGEPGWNLVGTNNFLSTGTSVGMRSLLQTGNTNTLPFNFVFDNFMADSPATSLYRVYPDGTRSLVRGSPFVYSANSAVVYDTEAPLNTTISYQLQACDATQTFSSNSVMIQSGDDGWLKDPLRPYNDLKLDNCQVHSPQCVSTDANVFFQRLEAEEYPSASGVFEIVDSARPLTVAQTRKDQKSALGIVSRKLSDITRIRALLSPGSPLFLQLPSRYGWGITTWSSDYIQVYDDRATRLGPDMGKPYRDWSLPFTMSRVPADVNSGNTGGSVIGPLGKLYQDSTATGRTYAQSTALGRTYLVRTQHPTF